ncbi:MAG: class I SAM-dependent RNA methyltransferase [Caldilineaceae bacterium]|nr:class I SAM-dependent RNA methyltransferase [Caldilineaceae bacterium]
MSNTKVTVTFTEIAQTGEAIARVDGQVLFVPFGLPGDQAEVMITERKRTFARGRLARLLNAAPQRITPRCAHFTYCGGCEWQHIPYPEQLQLKENNVRTLLTRIGKLSTPLVRPCLASPHVYGYRNHARLQRTTSGALGYRAPRSHDVVAVTACPILEPAVEALLAPAAPATLPADQPEVTVRVPMPLQIGAYSYMISPDAFFQANTAVAALLVQEVLHALALQGHEQILELYCGIGLFTIPLAAAAQLVVGVEANATATADAQVNVNQAGVSERVRLITAPVEQALRQPALHQSPWDALVLDPPRTGVTPQALADLLALGAPTIVYISCDPATLARDAQQIGAHGYQLRYAQPLDMFPQTHHVETLALFARD